MLNKLLILLFNEPLLLFNLLFVGGHSTFFGLLNTFVHIIMYAYYMLAAMGPQMQKYLWWKKYLTALQMVIYQIVIKLLKSY